jgi:hypothetical protein
MQYTLIWFEQFLIQKSKHISNSKLRVLHVHTTQISQPISRMLYKAFKSHKEWVGRDLLVVRMLLSQDRTTNNQRSTRRGI